MNVDTLLHQYFPVSGNLCIDELFLDGNPEKEKLLLEMPLDELKSKTTFTGLKPLDERCILTALKRRYKQIKDAS